MRDDNRGQCVDALALQLPRGSEDNEQYPSGKNELDWLNCFQHSSRLLIAVIDGNTGGLQFANESFCRVLGIASEQLRGEWRDRIPEIATVVETLLRRHFLYHLLRDRYGVEPADLRVLQQPIRTQVYQGAEEGFPRFFEFSLQTQRLQILPLNSITDELNSLIESDLLETISGIRLPVNRDALTRWEKTIQLENYPLEGQIFLAGLDVSEAEILYRLTQLLIGRGSVLRSKKFQAVSQLLRSLFRAQQILFMSAEDDNARLFSSTDSTSPQSTLYAIQSLQGSHFLRAVGSNQIWRVADLSSDCGTECERNLLQQGIRSLLIIPLVAKMPESHTGYGPLVGLVALMSDRIHHFDLVDEERAHDLIPALSTAMRQAIQQRLTLNNIHPAVAWRFSQEIERRSWGFPPETIVFTDVYPLYGISDIRSSSEERNRAIQADLLAQFRLGLAVVEAVSQDQNTPLAEQLRLDLCEAIAALETAVAVDAETTSMAYLHENLEIYFDYFAQCGTAAREAVLAYRTAADNEHQCVYVERDRYDQTIHQINTLLRETWERWQVQMQQIIPHYCDIECTDGIDHMIYVGASISQEFSQFHLHSLRYEQLRAVCDCARAALHLQEHYGTELRVAHLVLVQDVPVDIFHDEKTEKLFDVRGTRDTRYEIMKKRIDKAVEAETRSRITQTDMLTIVYSSEQEWTEYQQYLRYLVREGWIDRDIHTGLVEPLQGISGLKFARVRILPNPDPSYNPS